jgi:hypothetical protein
MYVLFFYIAFDPQFVQYMCLFNMVVFHTHTCMHASICVYTSSLTLNLCISAVQLACAFSIWLFSWFNVSILLRKSWHSCSAFACPEVYLCIYVCMYGSSLGSMYPFCCVNLDTPARLSLALRYMYAYMHLCTYSCEYMSLTLLHGLKTHVCMYVYESATMDFWASCKNSLVTAHAECFHEHIHACIHMNTYMHAYTWTHTCIHT